MCTNMATAQVILKPGGGVVIKMWINHLFLIPLGHTCEGGSTQILLEHYELIGLIRKLKSIKSLTSCLGFISLSQMSTIFFSMAARV